MNTVIVIPVGAGRAENMIACLEHIEDQTVRPYGVVLVYDGPEAFTGEVTGLSIPCHSIVADKHEPGKEQPRNIGVQAVRAFFPGATHVWFLDTDIIVEPYCLECFEEGHERAPDPATSTPPIPDNPLDRILLGPYEWLAEGVREPQHELQNDDRWPSFSQYGPEQVFRGDLSAGLACFSGNLIWPLAEFERVGGFWNELHHGRCEDGELGLRAVAMGIPISFVPLARGWHLWHPVDRDLAMARNARDVPMLNARHPWVQGEDLFVVDEDGKRFDQRCPECGELVNTALFWAHKETCGKVVAEGIVLPEVKP